MAKGQSQRGSMSYKPGMRTKDVVLPAGSDYKARLVSKGKQWQVKEAGKFPNRPCQFAIVGTESEVEYPGEEKRVPFYASLSPKAFAFFRDLIIASQYPEDLDFKDPGSNLDDPEADPTEDRVSLKHNAEQFDRVLDYIIENDITLNCKLSVEEYQGENKNGIYFLPADEGTEAPEVKGEAEESIPESAERDELNGEDVTQEEAVEEEPAPEPVPKAKSKPAAAKAPSKPVVKPTPAPARKPAKK